MNTKACQSGPLERTVGRHSDTCDQQINDGVFGFRKCANKPAPGDVLCKRHRAMAERTGYSPGIVVGSMTPNAGVQPPPADPAQ